ncbi:MAG: hypothetical protein CMJ32_12260 [Phycisphaerae bacterium]|nr:hypothetical protein [Phycisphaerae bacterium]
MPIFESMDNYGHEKVAYHQDPRTGLKAIIAVHSTKLGNALGGTRRWYYDNELEALHDVMRLSEGMTYKAAAADLAMGGAKSVVMLPKHGHEHTEDEARSMGQFVDTFNGEYIAAEDVGTSPEFIDWMAQETDHVMGGDTVSTGGDPSPFTSQGCFNAMKASLAHVGDAVDFSGLKVTIQGVGSTGYYLAMLLKEAGATVHATDINQENLRRAVEQAGVIALDSDADIFKAECDIFAPCAMGAILDADTIRNLRCRIVCGTANNVLADPVEDGALIKGQDVLYAPDFVANAGGLIRLAGLYLGMTEDDVDAKVAEIETTTADILELGKTHQSNHEAAVAFARARIDAGGMTTA